MYQINTVGWWISRIANQADRTEIMQCTLFESRKHHSAAGVRDAIGELNGNTGRRLYDGSPFNVPLLAKPYYEQTPPTEYQVFCDGKKSDPDVIQFIRWARGLNGGVTGESKYYHIKPTYCSARTEEALNIIKYTAKEWVAIMYPSAQCSISVLPDVYQVECPKEHIKDFIVLMKTECPTQQCSGSSKYYKVNRSNKIYCASSYEMHSNCQMIPFEQWKAILEDTPKVQPKVLPKKVTDLKDNEYIYCENEVEGLAIKALMHSAGLEWCTGHSYIGNVILTMYPYCFCPASGSQCTKSYAESSHNTMYPASQFLTSNYNYQINITKHEPKANIYSAPPTITRGKNYRGTAVSGRTGISTTSVGHLSHKSLTL